MGRPASEQESAGSAATAAALLAQALLDQLKSEEQKEDMQKSRAYVVGIEDVIEEKESVAAADMLLVVHEAPYDLVCGAASAAAGVAATAAVATCRQRAQQAGALQSALALDHDGDMVLHVDGSALRGLAGAVMVAEELLLRWGVEASAVDVKGAVQAVLLTSSAAAPGDASDAGVRRSCVDAIDDDAVCRAWHDFYYELFTAITPPLVDDDDVSAWLPGALEAAAAAAAAAAKTEGNAGQKVEPPLTSDKEAEPQAAAALGAAEPQPAAVAEEESAPAAAAAAAATAKPMRRGKWATTDLGAAEDEDELPELFYCLPGGGLNDITVEWWHCIEWAIQTGRTLVMGFENYLAPAPPYTPYFELRALPGLTTMSPAEAARRIRKARRRGKVTVFPRRLQRDPDPILVPACESEEERAAILAEERPWKFDWDNLHHLGFEFEKEYGQQVVVFHRKGNVGEFGFASHHTTYILSLTKPDSPPIPT